MAKKKNSKLRKERESKTTISIFSLGLIEPLKVVHPNEDQEDPINGKFEKTIEITPWGPDWQ